MRAAGRRRHARRTACALTLWVLAPSPGCTTRETGSIELGIASSTPKPKPPPKMPPAPRVTCASDVDCQMPKSRCNLAASVCAECIADVDCADPKRPFCIRDGGRCAACAPDASTACAPGETCGPDFMCRPR